jgi:hypothetical protein
MWLSTLGFDAGRFPPTPPACYPAPWHLPGPDSHRPADASLCPDQITECITSEHWAHDGAFMEPSATVRASGTRTVASAAAGEPPYALPPFGNSTCLIPADPSISV